MKNIVIIEDEQNLSDSFKELLEKAGYMCIVLSDGYHGLEYLENHKGEIDLLLLDLMMPGVDGLEILNAIKKNIDKYGNIPIIILSNMTSDTVIKDAFDLGASSYLLKSDIDSSSLIKEIEKFLAN